MLKNNPVQVNLNDDDDQDLAALVELERVEQKDTTIGAGTLLREFGMPPVRERLATLRKKHGITPPASDRRGGERRDGERRTPAPATR